MILDRNRRRKTYPLVRAEASSVGQIITQAYTIVSSGSVRYQQRYELSFQLPFVVSDDSVRQATNVDLASVGSPGVYTVVQVDQYGRVTSGSVPSVTPGVYTVVQVDQYGQIVGGSSGSAPVTAAGSYSDVTLNTMGAVVSGTLSLNIVPGTLMPVTVDVNGRVTGGTTGSASLAATYTTVVVNQYGQVTSGSTVSTAPGTYVGVIVDSQGHVVGGTTGSIPSTSAGSYGAVTVNTAGAVTSGTLALAITPGTMSPVIVDSLGRVTGGTTGSAALAGTYTSVAVNQYGQVTSGSSVTPNAGTYVGAIVDAQGRVVGGTSGSVPTTSVGSYSDVTINTTGAVTGGTLSLAITPGTLSPVTVDSRGRVIGGTTGSATLAGAYTNVVVNQYGQVTSGSLDATLQPAVTVLAGPLSGSAGITTYKSLTSLLQSSVTTISDVNDVYFGNMSVTQFLALSGSGDYAYTYAGTPPVEGDTFSGSNMRIGQFTRKYGPISVPVMGVQNTISGAHYPIVQTLAGGARTQDYIELTVFAGSNHVDGQSGWSLMWANTSGSLPDPTNFVLAQAVRFSENNFGTVCSLRQGGLTVASHITSGSWFELPSKIGIERNNTRFTVFASNGVNKRILLQTTSSITPATWTTFALGSTAPNPVFYYYSFIRATSATA